MKLKIKSIIVVSLVVALASCVSVPSDNNEKNQSNKEHSVYKKTAANSMDPAEKSFTASLDNIKIQLKSFPKKTSVGESFKSGFTVLATDKDGTPLSGFKLTVDYPSSKNDDVISYSTIDILTNSDGSYTFVPDVPSFSANAVVNFYPTPISDNKEVLDKCKKMGVSAGWKVQSDIIKTGAVLFVWDFNEKDKPVNNSYEILSEFRTRGMTLVGNAPVNETSYIGKSIQTLYKENYEIIENAYGYLIVGTVKYLTPVAALEDGNGYSCTFSADLTAVRMKDGAVVFNKIFKKESFGKNWTECTSKGKEQLSKEVVDALVYGL